MNLLVATELTNHSISKGYPLPKIQRHSLVESSDESASCA